MDDTSKKVSSLERIKVASNQLRGTIAAQLTNDTDHFDRDTVQILKHHGMYQQDDRDARARGGERRHMFLVRTRVPGGRLTSRQLLAELELCDDVGNGTLRITSRQGLQLHGVLKTDLTRLIQRIQAIDLTTLGACGDVNRNVMACPAPATSRWDNELGDIALTLAKHFAPRTAAYREIWLQDPETLEKQRVAYAADGTQQTVGDVEEPLYGRAYLPRKFKIGIAFPDDNCVDVHTHDLGLLAITEGEQIVGFNVLVGGGMGVTPAKKNTFPALAQPFAFIPVAEVIPVIESVVRVQRDHGNRSDRKTARLKYLIHDWGLDRFHAKVVEYYGAPLAPPRDVHVCQTCDHLGWHSQQDGIWYYGLHIASGRIHDTEPVMLKSALREICHRLAPGIRLTAYQNLLLTDIKAADRELLESILQDHGVVLSEATSQLRRWSIACVAWPTCGLAIAESERVLPTLMDDLEPVFTRLELDAQQVTVRMTGCPNGCVRPYNADIGLVGRARNQYSIYLGGSVLGTHLGEVFKDRVPLEQIAATLAPVLEYYRHERAADECFGDFCRRKGMADLCEHATS